MTGTFDIIHPGHIEILKFAKSQGDELTVGIDKDSRVKELKGDTRPFHKESDRVLVIKSIRYVDDVQLFGSDEELTNLIKSISPDVLIAGSDWNGKNIVGGEYAKEIVFFDRIADYSTTKILGEL
jgi:D-beta-D-heptose 7-phosphate kinase/D-beta-D-heptose 1-phosphate adenosyltransferase